MCYYTDAHNSSRMVKYEVKLTSYANLPAQDIAGLRRGKRRRSALPPWHHVERDAGREQGVVGAGRVGGEAGPVAPASLSETHRRRRRRALAAARGELQQQQQEVNLSSGDKRRARAAAARGELTWRRSA
jgi:hypothetical protein